MPELKPFPATEALIIVRVANTETKRGIALRNFLCLLLANEKIEPLRFSLDSDPADLSDNVWFTIPIEAIDEIAYLYGV